VVLGQGGLDLGEGVGGGCGWSDAGISQPLVRWEGFEERDGAVEEVWHFFSGLVVGVTIRFKGTDAGSVLSPLMFPERLGRS
jgi:hypothetical protein